jgi:uncharacterized protein (TIGR00297 family)
VTCSTTGARASGRRAPLQPEGALTGAPGFTRGELVRRLLHVGFASCALLLRWLAPWQAALLALAAFVFNWQVLPRVGGRGMWRHAELAQGRSPGMLAYPLALLGLVLVFHDRLGLAAAGWGILAVGDGMASLAGQVVGGPRLPWSSRKGWLGSASFVAFGAPAAALLWAWTERLSLDPMAGHWPRTLGASFALALACALVEALPTALDDNITVPIAVALLLPVFASVQPSLLLADPLLPHRLAAGLVLNVLAVQVALLARALDPWGAATTVVIGTAITAGLGLPGLALMATFFVLATATTRLGHRAKAARGIAQEKGGVRGFRHALANGAVPALLAVLAAMAPPGLRDLLGLAYAASVATAAADTCASELGKAYGRGTWSPTTLRPVPPGTEGALSLAGTLAGLAAPLAVGGVGAAMGLFGASAALLVGVAGFLGGLAESVIGSHAGGWLDDHLLNAANTALGAVFAVALAWLLGMLRAVPVF